MPKITFSDDELKNQLFFEISTQEDGSNGPGFTRFGGFFRSDALLRARDTRRLFGIFQHYNKILGDRMRMSDHLTFLASLFREIEDQENPIKRENPCGEIVLPTSDVANLPLTVGELYRCPRCGATSDAAPFDPPGPTCRRQPCYGRGETDLQPGDVPVKWDDGRYKK